MLNNQARGGKVIQNSKHVRVPVQKELSEVAQTLASERIKLLC
jgi:hypothetical protein